MVRRSAAVAVTLAVFALLAPPAWACGCGAYSPADGATASVPSETALVRWPGDGTEDVYLSLSVTSTAAGGALLFPVPDPKAVVSAGPPELFTRLAAITAPRVYYRAGGGGGKGAAAAPAPAVTVENRQQIGPLEVVTLATGDSDALSQWLTDNGFAAKPALAAAARPYTRQGWAFVAVRLRPGAGTAPLDGALDPLKIHFSATEPVYPMRLSAMATSAETVRVYTLAAHRLDLRSADPGMSPVWADSVANYSAEPVFDGLLGTAGLPTRYLTSFSGTLTPSAITDDFHFVRAATDTSLVPVTVVDGGSASTAGVASSALAAIGAAGVVVVAGILFLAIRLARRRHGVERI